MMEFPVPALESYIVRGTILHSDIFEDIDHGKFFVVVGVSDDYVAGFFYVNSNINRHIFGKPDQLELQYPMFAADYPFLKYNSFLCASSLVKRRRDDLARSISEGRTQIIDNMKPEHMQELLEAVRGSILFSAIEKKKFFA